MKKNTIYLSNPKEKLTKQPMTFSWLIRETRLTKGLTQEELTAKTGIGTTSIQGYETGLSLGVIDRLTDLIDVLGLTEAEVNDSLEESRKMKSELRKIARRMKEQDVFNRDIKPFEYKARFAPLLVGYDKLEAEYKEYLRKMEITLMLANGEPYLHLPHWGYITLYSLMKIFSDFEEKASVAQNNNVALDYEMAQKDEQIAERDKELGRMKLAFDLLQDELLRLQNQ